MPLNQGSSIGSSLLYPILYQLLPKDMDFFFKIKSPMYFEALKNINVYINLSADKVRLAN